METIRITFRSEIYIEGEDMEDVKRKWMNVPLYNAESVKKHGLGFCEIVSVTDEDDNDVIFP